MKYFKEQTILGRRLNGHEEITPINNDNQEEYIKELVSLPYFHEDVKKIMLFLSNRIKELELYYYSHQNQIVEDKQKLNLLIEIIKSDIRLVRVFKIDLCKMGEYDFAANFRKIERDIISKNSEEITNDLEKLIIKFAEKKQYRWARKSFLKWMWENSDEVWSDQSVSNKLTKLTNLGILNKTDRSYISIKFI